MSRRWLDHIDSILKWFQREVAISRRVLRLRASIYLKIPWIETSDMLDYFLRRGLVREVKDNRIWMAPPEYLDGIGQVREEYEEEFKRKKDVYDRWVSVSESAGYYAEELFKGAFIDAGYSAKKIIFDCPNGVLSDSSRQIEIDVFCVKDKWHLGVQIKNITSDVIINPSFVKEKSNLYKTLVREFDFCSKNRIVSLLIAPFIERSFYVFDDMHRGLHCQTFLQLFGPEHERLCNDIGKILHFGNVRAVTEIPPHARDWILRIPQMWEERFGSMKNSFRSLEGE